MSNEDIIHQFDPPVPIPRKPPEPLTFRKVVEFAFWGILPVWFKPLTWWLVFSPSRPLRILGSFGLMMDSLLGMVLLAALCILLASPVLLCFRRTRGWVVRCGLFSAIFLPGFILGEFLGHQVWREGYEQFVVQSEPLIRAISAYESAHDRPPPTLAELIPEFLPSVPTPRTGGQYLYYAGKETEYYENNPWALRVPVPCHVMGFDEMLYFPRQNYPAHGFGGRLERIGSWAYVHE